MVVGSHIGEFSLRFKGMQFLSSIWVKDEEFVFKSESLLIRFTFV